MEVLRYNATTSRSNFIQQELPLSQSSNASPQKESARRRLNFGSTASHTCAQQANSEFVQQLMFQLNHSFCKKWEFDFETGLPLPLSSTSRFHYKQVETKALPALYSPVVQSSTKHDEDSLSDSENRCVHSPVNLNCLTDRANSVPQADYNDSGLKESKEFVFPCQATPKKTLKKPLNSVYSTPKKSRDTRVTDYIVYRKRKSITGISKSSPTKSPKIRHGGRVASLPYALRRHSLAN